jgi:DNA recombination protein RmuC
VLLVGPATLVAMLKTVAYSWRQEVIAANAERVRDLGQELYDRIGKLADHVEKVGKGLRTAVEGYNSAVGTLESRVLVSARKFKELGVDSPRDIPLVEPLDLTPRALQAPEFERALPASTVAAASDSPTHLSRGAPADAPALPPASG